METRNARSRRERGQTLVLFVLLLAVLMGFVALSIDVGLILHERRQLQTAADAAALAGAQELDDSPAGAIAMAYEYAVAHGVDLTDPGYTFEATTPYQGDTGQIEVKVSHDVGFIFGRVLGLDFADVPARAVAQATPSPNYAIFIGPGCAEGEVEGSNLFVDGAVHVDALEIEGGAEVTGSVTYVCGYEGGANPNFGSGPTQLPQTPPPPVNFDYSDFNCTPDLSVNGDLDISNSTPQYFVNDDPSTGELKPGVYCATGDIEIEESGLSGNVTFASQDEIEIEGGDFNFTAYQDGVLAYAGGSDLTNVDASGDSEGEIELEGSNSQWVGMLLAPSGEIELEGSNLVSPSTLLLAGEELELEGTDISLTAMEPPGPTVVRLIE